MKGNDFKGIYINGDTYMAKNIPREIKNAFSCIDNELSVSSDELPKIFNYITNLQEEKENAVECLKYYEEKHFIKPVIDNTKLTLDLYSAYMKDINDLQEENENLKKQYKKEEKKLFHDNEILQTRIDKAVEYIKWDYDKNEEVIDYCGFNDFYKHLLDILRGNDNE